MTRSSIELATKIFIVVLSCVFLWTLFKVAQEVGWV
jgi:hypothetical protein